MSINDTIVLFTEPLKHTSFFGAEYIVGLGLIFILMAIVTRDMHKWKTLALPMTVLLHGLGITQHYLIFAISTITFGVSNLSMSVVGNILQSAKKGIYAVGGLTKSATKTAIGTATDISKTREIAQKVSFLKGVSTKEKKNIIEDIIRKGRRPERIKSTFEIIREKRKRKEKVLKKPKTFSERMTKDRLKAGLISRLQKKVERIDFKEDTQGITEEERKLREKIVNKLKQE